MARLLEQPESLAIPAETVPQPTILECMERLDALIVLPEGAARGSVSTPGGTLTVEELAGIRSAVAFRRQEAGEYHGKYAPADARVEYRPNAQKQPILRLSGGLNATPQAINDWLEGMLIDVAAIVNPEGNGEA